MTRKIYTAEELEKIRIKKNEALKKWRHSHKEHVSLYMKNWYAARKEKKLLEEIIEKVAEGTISPEAATEVAVL